MKHVPRMKHVDEYRDPALAQRYLKSIEAQVTRPWTVMEICGGQTHAIVRYGIDQLLPTRINLVHGPGCPVCVTPIGMIDNALEIAARPEVIFCSFGDMARVPGSTTNLLTIKARGADVRMVYSPLDALQIARDHPEREVVFFSVGFETTAPTSAMAAWLARREQLHNFSLLVAHVRVPPAMQAILSAPVCAVQGFLAAGHVCAVMGLEEYGPIAEEYHIPIVVTGFEPLDILQGLEMLIRQLESGTVEVQNQYARVVQREGNRQARERVEQVFDVVPRYWRGIGEIDASGLGFRPEYAQFDAGLRFGVANDPAEPPSVCISGEVMRGLAKPVDCSAFGSACTPEHPLGAPMVSSEGACAAYHRHRRRT